MMQGRNPWLILFALLILVGGGTFLYQQRTREYVSEQFLMDTLVTIRVYGHDPDALKNAVNDAFAVMHRVADLVDRFPTPGSAAYGLSDICRINAQAGIAPVQVAPETLEMLTLAQKYHAVTSAAFDVTIGPVMDLWGFAGDHPHIPSTDSLAAALTLVDNRFLQINTAERTVYLQKAGMKLDLGAIAKGYATEQAVQLLKSRGIKKALIDAGGNIRVLGTNLRDTPWRIGIKDPRKENAMVAIVPLEDAAAVTSGDYYRYFEVAGKRYHHIIDPRIGTPAQGSMSVTVVARDAGLADIFSTAFFVLQADEALKLAEKIGVELFLVTADGRILHTPGLRGRIEVTATQAYRYEPR